MSGPDIRGCNVLIAGGGGVDNWKVVVLFVVSEYSKCHGPVVFGIGKDRTDNRNIMALCISQRHWNVMTLITKTFLFKYIENFTSKN